MSNEIKDGGPAFPQIELNRVTGDYCDQHFGASLRDYFAARASEYDINFHICHHFNNKRDMKLFPNQGIIPDRTREQARYQYADAMLAAREAKP